MQTADASKTDTAVVRAVFRQVSEDLALLIGRAIGFGSPTAERADERPAGMGLIHISFKLHVETGQGRLHGCLLVPLPDAISLACYVLEIPDGAIESRRRLDELDESMKDAMLEIGNFVGGSVEAALRSLGMSGIKVHSEGCQGVRANVRPALVYEEGTPLVVGRATIQLDGLPESEAILILPDLSGLEQPDE